MVRHFTYKRYLWYTCRMDEVLKMDVFFFVTTIAVALVGLLVSIAGLFVLAILRDLRDIVRIAKREAQDIVADFDEIREDIREGVHDVRESVVGGVKTATKTASAVVGSGAGETLTLLLESLLEARARKRGTRSRRGTR